MKTPALELKSVRKIYKSRQHTVNAVQDVSFTIKAGEVFGFLGPNGAGKTTTMKMIIGLALPTSGTISIFGHAAGTRESASLLGYMPENPTFYRYLSGLEFVTMHGQLAGLTSMKARTQALELLDSVGMANAQHRRIGEYSKGMVQRTGLAQALIGDPQILFLDEPFDGLDVLGRFEMKQVLLDLKKSHKTIFFNSHILSDVEEICDSVGIIDGGQLLECAPIKTLIHGKGTLEDFFVERIEKNRGKS